MRRPASLARRVGSARTCSYRPCGATKSSGVRWGTPGAPRPVLRGGSNALQLVRARWVVLHDLEITGSDHNGVNCDDGGDMANPEASHHLVFRRLSIHDVGGDGNQDCLKLSGIRHFRVEDCELARCGGNGSGSGVDHVGCHHGIITGCHFSESSGNAIQIKGGSTDILVHGNRMHDAGERAVNMGGSTGPQFFRPRCRRARPTPRPGTCGSWPTSSVAPTPRSPTSAASAVWWRSSVVVLRSTFMNPWYRRSPSGRDYYLDITIDALRDVARQVLTRIRRREILAEYYWDPLVQAHGI